MPEYISRETLRDLMYTEAFERDTGLQRWDSGLWIRYKLFENCLEAIPAADVVEVVRCRDCEFTKRDGMDDPAIYCKKWDRWEMPPDAYCWLGKRKDGGQKDG